MKCYEILYKTSTKLLKYFNPLVNHYQGIGYITSMIAMPALAVGIPYLFIERGGSSDDAEDTTHHPHLLTLVLGASAIAIVNGLQEALTVTFGTYSMQKLKEENISKLMDEESKVLLYHSLENDGIKIPRSIHYMTVGEGVRDFAIYGTRFFTVLPMYIATVSATLIQVYKVSDSSHILGAVVGFSTASAIASQFLGVYFTADDIEKISKTDIDILNVMIMTLSVNIQNIITTFTLTYSFIERNLPYLIAFDKACEEAKLLILICRLRVHKR